MVIQQKLEGITYSIDIYGKDRKCAENCILLHIGNMSLKFKTLNKLKGLLEHNNVIEFNNIEEERTFKEKVAAIIKEIQCKYSLEENEDF